MIVCSYQLKDKVSFQIECESRLVQRKQQKNNFAVQGKGMEENMGECVLVVDDDREIVKAIGILLEGEGYEVLKAYDGLQALDILSAKEVRLVIIDVMMPKLDGLSALMRIRERRNLPVIVLSAKSEESDKVLGLSMGADDYVTKPFSMQELTARVRSQLRRYTTLGGMEQKPSKIVIGSIAMDDEAKTVSVDGEPVSLTPIEYNILLLLARHPGRVYSSAQIYEQVWNESAIGSEGAVAVHIRHLREKIEINPSEPRYLKVVWGLGYKMEANQ